LHYDDVNATATAGEAGAIRPSPARPSLRRSPRARGDVPRRSDGEVGDEECHGEMPAPVRTRRIARGPPRYWRGRDATAAPVCCMVWSIPDAAPASARGTPARIVTLTARSTNRPRCRRARASEQALEIALGRRGLRDPERRQPSVNSPNRSIGRAPNRLTSRGVMRELAKIRPVMGKNANPASMALKCRSFRDTG